MQVINFTNFYFKLSQPTFTSVRGKFWYKKVLVNDIFLVRVHNMFWAKAKIVKKELRQLQDLSLDFMKKDAEYSGFTIISKQQYLNLLNSFIRFENAKATLQSEKTILYFEKVNF